MLYIFFTYSFESYMPKKTSGIILRKSFS